LSAIFGLVRLDGRPVVTQELEAMRRGMAYWGRDGGATWLGQAAGLGQLVARETPEEEQERGPLVLPSGVAVAAAGRVDNREQLCRELELAAAQREQTADGELIARAYERWGAAAPRRVLGDWAFAAWHPKERRLFLARDHYGQTALYFHRAGALLAFASSLKAILALEDVPRRLNETCFVRTAYVIVDGDGFPTLYDRIERVPPAHTVEFDRSGLRKHEFWDLRDVPAVRLGSDGAYLEAFVEAFGNAVRARLRSNGPIATTLSAGLDSAAVTALAARELGEAPLTAYTARPAYPEVADEMPGLMVDEWPGAELVAGAWANVRHVEVRGRGKSPVEAFRRSVWIHEQPEHAAPNLPWVLALLEQATAAGEQVLLTGQMGNGGVSWGGDDEPVLNALAAGDVRGAVRALTHLRHVGRGGWRGAIWRGLVLPLRRRHRRRQATRDPRRQPAWELTPIAPELAQRVGIADRAGARAWSAGPARSTLLERRLDFLLPGYHPVGAHWHEKGAAHGLAVRDPTMDVPLLELCFGFPEEQFASCGQDRRLARRALAGLVPAEVARNRRRGAQAADFAHRLRAHSHEVSDLIRELGESEAVSAYLDVARMAESWRAVGTGDSGEALGLARGMLLGVFLLRAHGSGAV
jgi:asparagine synthase (glutamine-hydrolysing)